ncbi:Uma2 family endonuclease [Catelliglobosispora koreensis]|uniref:Uma2 family endonuclease n=1 Tax=Catelliglobosispora koreensis TaxID=129052 RepID=UPI0003694E75|nr:Uma2 family endonuclease [Catelliglobosispora koreensis]
MFRIDLEDTPFEISDGKLEIMTPPSVWHQLTVDDVQEVLKRRYPTVTGDVPVSVGDNGRRPDIVALSLSRQFLKQSLEKGLTADMIELAVEVISHDTDRHADKAAVKRDRETKMHEYASAGIPEYWIIDEIPANREDAQVEIYHLRDGSYVPALLSRLSLLANGEVEIPTRAQA